ncbi:putative leucine-rich repeat-containing protein 49-like [Scophthalmus maximus]|uniref:Putative leucine-rich repeat-containing protein 49-like n=1 Tax=Scophthalmus maximus TaxID=52904 RepID=A0A2U9B5V9_SCOMX|nr:putative leucine-rich repeat-containing protein 49-like [Scophthalmus maximus]
MGDGDIFTGPNRAANNVLIKKARRIYRQTLGTCRKGVNTLSGSLPKSHSAHHSDLDVTRTPLSVDHSPDSGLVSTPLPSSRFQFASWHRLEQCEVTGDQLTCPRVREGPSEEELRQREGDDVRLVRGGRRRREDEGQRWEERLQENWENCLELNLSYQDLGDPFQRENFLRILRRLIRVEKLQLVDNSLTNLSSVRLPRCRMLNLHRNHLVCPRQLPKLPAVEHLCLSDNAIGSLVGLGALDDGPLRSLNLSRNPVTFAQDYRARVFSCLPKLEVLDGIPRLPEDSPPTGLHFPETTRMCSIL